MKPDEKVKAHGPYNDSQGDYYYVLQGAESGDMVDVTPESPKKPDNITVELLAKRWNEYDTLKAKIYSLELENIALRGAESAAVQEFNEAIKLLRSSYRGHRLDSEDHFRITELIKETK